MKRRTSLIFALIIVILLSSFSFVGCEKDSCDHIFSSWIVDNKATLESAGSEHIECTSCGKVLQTREIPKLVCEHQESDWIIDSQATQLASGSKHTECTKCKTVLKTETIPIIVCSHPASIWVIDKQATRYTPGTKHEECIECKTTLRTEVIPIFTCDHTETTWIIDKEASFDSFGTKHLECADCGAELDFEIIPIVVCEHNSIIWIVDRDATKYNTGSKHSECSDCGTTFTTEEIPKLDYSLSEVKQKLSSAIVKVYCYDYDGETLLSQGSGFFINGSGVFITNAHVVEDAYYIKVENSFGLTYDVDYMYSYSDVFTDYAICHAKNCFTSNHVVFEENISAGETVYALGYPNDSILLSATEGKVITADLLLDNGCFIENTAKIDHGSSGGVLVNGQGEVVGITTGILDNGNYAAIRYRDFKYDIKTSYFGTKTPLEWFHTVKEVSIASYNVDRFFDAYVTAIATTDTSVNYQIVLKIKDKYKDEKMVIDSLNITVNVNLKTKYEWKEPTSYGSSNKSQSTTDYLTFYFYSVDDLINGDSSTAYSSIFVSSFSEYYDMEISYEVDFSSGLGTLIFYDTYQVIY